MVTSDPVLWELAARGLSRARGRKFTLLLRGRRYDVHVSKRDGMVYQVVVNGRPVDAQLAPLGKDIAEFTGPRTKMFRVQVGGRWLKVEVGAGRAGNARLLVDGQLLDMEMRPAGQARGAPAVPKVPQAQAGTPEGDALEKRITAAMPGRIVAVSVKPGQAVVEGQEVCVLEAMKMEQIIRTPTAGVVKAVPILPGQSVVAGDLLIEME
ncbi:MAG: acetyl-CoA carboxylase biotin carboxyl carrier protein subunit [Dehalococcoidia bacterium]|nr:acetyl-CoA carboxylase biotin carboxyl carrier protein subunit [Dehalococcoidia bacterium]